jgi:hypothetical protein
MVLAKEGLFFIKIIQVKRPGNGGSYFKFEYNSEDHYFKNEIVKGAFEYFPGKIIILTNG